MITVFDNQSLFDIAIQRLGSAETALTLALLNGLSVTDVLEPGQVLISSEVFDSDVVEYYSGRNLVPATGNDDIVTNPIIALSVYSDLYFNIESQILVSDNQSLFDVAIQRLGSAEAALTLALLNGLSVTDVLEPGQIVIVPEVHNSVVDYYSRKNIVPATSATYTGNNEELVFEGIDYWAVAVDFFVS